MSKRRRIIEGRWKCGSCGVQDILGRHKTCPNCGNPRDAMGNETNFDFGQSTAGAASSAVSVSDAEGLELAGAGADWFCPYCESANRGDGNICVQCGANRLDHSASEKPIKSNPQKISILPLIALVVGFVLCAGCCGLGFWGSQTEPVKGQVSKVEWTHTIELEQFQPTQKDGWLGELDEHASKPPVGGKGEVAGVQNIRDCTRKIHSYRSIPDGQEEVCREESIEVECGVEEVCVITDLGNGFAEEECTESIQYCTEYEERCSLETKYRQEPIYDDWCRYDTMEWVPLNSRTASGNDSNPVWPDISDLRLVREKRIQDYSVTFRVKTEGEVHEWVYKPEAEQSFKEWTIGQEADLEINNFGNIDFPDKL